VHTRVNMIVASVRPLTHLTIWNKPAPRVRDYKNMYKQAYRIESADPLLGGQSIPVALERNFLSEVGKVAGSSMFAQGVGLVLGKTCETRLLTSPTAIFRGLKRNLLCTKDPAWYGPDRVYVFITTPKADASIRGGQLVDAIPPHNSVFMIYIRLYDDRRAAPPYVDPDSGERFVAYGVVANWEWAKAAPDDARLPLDHTNRFTARIR
jgi:hypothetical protein